MSIAQNLSALSAVSSALSLTNLVLVNPANTTGYQPLNPPSADGVPSLVPQPPSFIFNYEGENRINLKSDITDHYVEDNTPIQDQISLKPEHVTVHGYIGELTDILPDFLQALQSAATKLTSISAFAPAQTATALIAYTDAVLAYEVTNSVLNAASSTWSSLGALATGGGSQLVIGSSGENPSTFLTQNNQQSAFQLWYLYWQSKTLFNIQTPWAVFTNMAIEDMEIVQDEATRVITDFKIIFKLIRTASTLTLGSFADFTQGRLQSQSASSTNTGSSTGNGVGQPSVSGGVSGMGAPVS